MYSNSYTTTLFAPSYSMYSFKNFTNVILKGILDRFTDYSRSKNGINSSVIGYNEEKQVEIIYSMAFKSINAMAKKYITANAALDNILELKDNWNNNGAKCFAYQFVEKCRTIVNDLVFEPFVCPTACGSIQFEYEKENGDYLEFEIYEDRIEVYSDTRENGEQEFNLHGVTAADKMKQLVVDFYG